MPSCDYCGKSFYGGDGLTDNSDYMCGKCMDGFSQLSDKQLTATLKNIDYL